VRFTAVEIFCSHCSSWRDEEIARTSLVVNETALIQISIDRLEDRNAACSFLNGQPLGGRELE
jgi:hypothetical protein